MKYWKEKKFSKSKRKGEENNEGGQKKIMAPYYNSRGAKKTIFIVRFRVNCLSKNLLSP
jgi:hypothetical protein